MPASLPLMVKATNSKFVKKIRELHKSVSIIFIIVIIKILWPLLLIMMMAVWLICNTG
jgi:hypothetical protein